MRAALSLAMILKNILRFQRALDAPVVQGVQQLAFCASQRLVIPAVVHFPGIRLQVE